MRPARDPIRWAAAAGSLVAAAALAALVGLFAVESLPVWRHEGLNYLGGTTWFFRARRFGAAPMIYGTLAVSGLAVALGAPVALGAALFTAERLGGRVRLAVKGAIELLAGIPSVVYGLLGVLLLRERMAALLAPLAPLSGDTLATAGVLLAVMILPTVTTLADDALRGVPAAARRAARGLGLTAAQTAVSIVLPRALPGLAAALLLGLGRALGETVAVYLVIGRQDNQWPERLVSLFPLARAGQTLTTKLGGAETFLAWGDPLHFGALAGLALLLLALVLTLTVGGGVLAGGGGRRA